MDISNLLRASYLDIIFEGRNKAYGGYELRQKYAGRSRRAGIFVATAAALLSGIPTLASMLGKPPGNMPRFDTTIVSVAPPPDLPKQTIAPPPPPAHDFNPPPTIAATVMRVVPNEEAERPPATIEDMHENEVGPTASTGTGTPGPEIGPSATEGMPGGREVEAPAAPPAVLRIVEVPARFNGDLGQWLNANLRYPEAAREAGLQGRSILEFIVNEDGSIEGLHIVRSSHPVLDAEALRVVGNMPKWKPGKQNGKPVRMYFTLPIGFQLD